MRTYTERTQDTLYCPGPIERSGEYLPALLIRRLAFTASDSSTRCAMVSAMSALLAGFEAASASWIMARSRRAAVQDLSAISYQRLAAEMDRRHHRFRPPPRCCAPPRPRAAPCAACWPGAMPPNMMVPGEVPAVRALANCTSTSAVRPAKAASIERIERQRRSIGRRPRARRRARRARGRAHRARACATSLREASRSPPSSGTSAARASGAMRKAGLAHLVVDQALRVSRSPSA